MGSVPSVSSRGRRKFGMAAWSGRRGSFGNRSSDVAGPLLYFFFPRPSRYCLGRRTGEAQKTTPTVTFRRVKSLLNRLVQDFRTRPEQLQTCSYRLWD